MSSTDKTIVLVHGGFVNGSGWRGVYDELTRDGYRVRVVQNATVSLAGDVTAAQTAMAERLGATVLETPGSHAIYVSRPAAVADIIRAAAQ
ncbi:hypothetical protein [Nocardia tengchongensis]